MKPADLAVLGLAALALYFVTRAKRPAASVPTASTYRPEAVFNGALPGQEGYAWQYFTDGVAISPDGIYYKNGAEVWRP